MCPIPGGAAVTSTVDRDSQDAASASSSVGTIAVDRGVGVTTVRALKGVGRWWPPAIVFFLVFSVWESAFRFFHVSLRYLPAPSDVLSELFGRPGWYWHHAQVTLQEAGLGFLLGGGVAFVAAYLMAESSIAHRALLPFFVVLKVTPAVVLVPLMVVLLGFGMWPKVVLAALTLFYAMLINTVTGFKSVDEGALEIMRSVDASRGEVFFKLRLPNSLPYLLSAAKIGVPLAVLGAVFAEIYNSVSGLGNIVRTAGEFGGFSAIWSAIYVLALIGLVLIGIVTLAERRLLRWHVSQKGL